MDSFNKVLVEVLLSMKMLIKVLIIIVLLTFVIGIKQSNNAVTEKYIEKKSKSPAECCDEINTFFPQSRFGKCYNECKDEVKKDGSLCCIYLCITKESNMLKDDEIDSETAIASLQKLAGDDKDWMRVRFV